MELPFILPPSPDREEIAPGIYVEDKEKTRTIIIGAAKVMQYPINDRFYNNTAAALLTDLGCVQKDVAKALKIHRNTISRISENVAKYGLEALVDSRDGSPGPRKMTPQVIKHIDRLYGKGLSPQEIHKELSKKNAISLRSIQRHIKEIHKKQHQDHKESPKAEQCLLALSYESESKCQEESPVEAQSSLSASENDGTPVSLQDVFLSGDTENDEESAGVPPSEDSEALSESSLKNDFLDFSAELPKSPGFDIEEGNGISYAGAFLAMPYLNLIGILPLAWKLYGKASKLGGKIYGLIHAILSYFFLNFLGFDNLEAFKTVDREGFRRLIGALSSPTVKTLRGKLGVISSLGKGYEFLKNLAKRYCVIGMLELGVLYLDGHFIPYFGKRDMGKGYYTMRRLAHPGRTQHFVNDRNGRPLFFLLREANESFVKIIPELIRETHELIGKKQVTFVFDRGGQSGGLFKEIEEGGDLFITYKKGKFRSMPGGAFRSCKTEYYRWGKKFEKIYDLWEGTIKIAGYGKARLILVKKNGHQTPVITNDRMRSAIDIISLMFDRWRQENFFKYMAANYSIDELVTHEEHEIKPALVANPQWHELEKKIRDTRKKITVMERGIGKFVAKGGDGKAYDDERKSPFVQKMAALKRMKTRLNKLKEDQKQCSAKISPSEIGKDVCTTIPQEGKIILDAVKLAVYNAEEWLLEIMQQYYRDWRDPRPIVRMIIQQKGDIQVNNGVVKVTLHKFGNPSYQKAAQGLCEALTNLEARSWDGRWKFVYEVADKKCTIG